MCPHIKYHIPSFAYSYPQALYELQQKTRESIFQYYIAGIHDKLESAVKKRYLNTERPIACLLSGGLDSSLVAAIASMEMKNRGMKLRTFSIGMEGGTDLKYARLVADHIDSEHTEVIFTPEEGLSVLEDVIKTCETYDTTTIRASVGQYLLARWISQNTNIKVVLNGDGADECMMGYLYNYYSPSHIDSHNDCLRLLDEIHLELRHPGSQF
jgi:asparagine synthase (glutamine-hydrolysing)